MTAITQDDHRSHSDLSLGVSSQVFFFVSFIIHYTTKLNGTIRHETHFTLRKILEVSVIDCYACTPEIKAFNIKLNARLIGQLK